MLCLELEDWLNSLFTPSSAPKQVKKADVFSTTGPKVEIKTPNYMNNTNNNDINNNINTIITHNIC